MASRSGTGAHLKGAVAVGFLGWFRAIHGDAAVDRALARLGAERADYDAGREALGLLPSTWYPADRLHRLLDACTAELPATAFDDVAREAGDAIIASIMTGLHRQLFRLVMTPDRYARYINAIWRQNSDTGRVDIVPGPREHHSTISSWAGHHPLMCRMVVYGKLRIYRTMGCEEPRVEVLGCAPTEGCTSRVRW
jgi:hypothetical protein